MAFVRPTQNNTTSTTGNFKRPVIEDKKAEQPFINPLDAAELADRQEGQRMAGAEIPASSYESGTPISEQPTEQPSFLEKLGKWGYDKATNFLADITNKPSQTWLDSAIKTDNVTAGAKLGLATAGAAKDVLLNVSDFARNALMGREQKYKPDYSATEYMKQGGIDLNKIDNPWLRGTAIGAAELVSDPLTFFGGGIIDDIAKVKKLETGAGYSIGEAAKQGQNISKGILLAKESNPPLYVDPYGNAVKNVNDAPLLLPAAKKNSLPIEQQVKVSTFRQPKQNIPVENTVNKVSTFRNKTPVENSSDTLYHGTWRKHQGFNEGQDFYFTNDKEYAKSYIREPREGTDLGGELLQGKFKPESKILDTRTPEGMEVARKIIQQDDAMSYFGVDDFVSKNFNDGLPMFAKDDLAKEVKKLGYDAMIISERDGVNSYRIFNPKSIDVSTKNFTPSATVQKATIPQTGSQQIGQPILSSKTIQAKVKSNPFVLNENNIDRPFTARKNELTQQSLTAQIKQGNVIPPSTQKTVLNASQASQATGKANFDIQSGIRKNPFNIKNGAYTAYNKLVDNTSEIGNSVGESGTVAANVARNSGGTVEYSIKNGLVNMEGKKIVEGSLNDAFNLPKGEQEVLNNLLFHKNNIDRLKQGKPLDKQITSQQSKQAIAEIESAYPHLKDKIDTIRKTLDGLIDEWGVPSGLVSPELRDTLRKMYPDYVPSYRVLNGTDAISYKSRGMGPAKIVNKAVGGNDPLQLLQESIPTLMNKTIKASRKNEVYNVILDAVEKNPENGFATIIKPANKFEAAAEQKLIDSITDTVKADGIEGLASISEKALESDPKLGYILTVMRNGKPVRLSIKKELFDSLQALSKVDDTDLGQFLQGFKKYATNPFKALITGYNPLFAIRNIARDIPTAYIQGKENNPFKFAKNLYDAGKDMAKKSDKFKEYQALGGEGGNFFNVEKGLNYGGKGEKVKRFIGAINNATETLPRYGEYLGTLKRGGEGYTNKMQALNDAQEVTVNFGRHGNLTKSIDALVPYLNPAVQGIDKFARTFIKNPGAASAKSALVVTAPAAVAYAINQAMDKKGYDQLDNRTKDTYFLIPEKLWGGESGQFIKVPKTREAGVLFGALFERLARLAEGQDGSFKGFGETVKTNFLPNNPITSNYLYPASQAVGDNGKDFAGRDVVPKGLQGFSPRYQYDNQTSEIAQKIGDTFNISPKKLDYLMKSYLGAVSQIGLPLNTKANTKNVFSSPFKADPLYNNEIQNEFYDNLNKATTTKRDSGLVGGKVNDNLISGMNRSSNDISNVRAMMKSIEGNSSLGEEQKQAKMRSMQQEILDIAQRANESYKKNDSSIGAKYPEISGQYYPEKEFTYKKEKITLTPDEYEAYRNTAKDRFTSLYNKTSSKDKEEVIKSLIEAANNYAQTAILKKRGLIK